MEIPIELDGTKVMNITNNSIDNQYGYIEIVDDDRILVDKIPITAVAICQYEGSNEYYLFSCDLNWEDIGDMDYDCIPSFTNPICNRQERAIIPVATS